MTDALCFHCSWDLCLLPPGGTVFFFQLDRDTKYNTVCAQSVFHLSPVQRLTQSTHLSCLFFTAGFPDYVSPPRGGDLPHHVLIREQHGTRGNLGHVSPRCSRRADRGERGWFGHMGGALKLRFPSFTTVQCTAIIIHLWSNWDPPSELVILSDVSQAAVNVIMWFGFLYQGCQDGQLRQMSDTVQPPVCNVCNSLHKFQAGSLPCLVSVTHFLFTPP